jgi:hypothetical protein
MTLTEYANRYNDVTDIETLSRMERVKSGEVILQDSEVKIIHRMKRKNVYSYTIVQIPMLEVCYMVIDGYTTLRTMDSDGNPDGHSVFSYKVPTEILK